MNLSTLAKCLLPIQGSQFRGAASSDMSRSRSWNWLTGPPSELPVGFTDVNTYDGIFSQTDPASDLRSYSVTLVQVNWRVWFQLLEPLALNLRTNYAMCEDPCLWHRSYSVTLRLSYLTCMISGSGTWTLIVHWHTGGPQATHNNRCLKWVDYFLTTVWLTFSTFSCYNWGEASMQSIARFNTDYGQSSISFYLCSSMIY